MFDRRTRSLFKAISWRVVATLTTIILVYIFTGELSISLGVGSLEVVAKTGLYYLHERMWNMASFGKKS